MALAVGAPAAATVWEVNGASPTCSDAGLGDATQPFCTIGMGAGVAVAGDTVNVAPAVYREQVKPAQSGAAGLPITLRASGPGAVVLGTDTVTGPWTPATGTSFVHAFTPVSPPCRVVLVDGVPLVAAASLAALVPGSFFFDAGANQLTVDLGGDDPGLHAVEAGSRGFGFDLQPRSWIVVQGFEVRGQNTTAIRTVSSTTTPSANNAILENKTAYTGQFGILVENTAGPNEVRGNDTSGHVGGGIRLRNNAANTQVADNHVHDNAGHGIRLTDSPDNVLVGNVCSGNGDAVNHESTGIDIDLSSDRARIQGNVTFQNFDTGIEVTDADDAIVVRNLSYGNGDHGFDIRDNAGTRLVSNTSYGNHNDGISIEGAVTSITLANNLSVENGVTTVPPHHDLYVDAFSAVGFVGDYDLVWNSGPTLPILFGGVEYATLAALNGATGQEAHGVTADPAFLDPAGGDFHPGLGAALDSADASAAGFELLDLDGQPPLDLPGIADTGAGVPSYADRGALEYQDTAPTAQLRLSRPQIKLGTLLTADGSRSKDDVGIVSYRFAWGDGSADTVQATAIATHSYAAKGRFKVTLTVTDGAGFQASQSKWVRVR